jgi:hypothetical protein
MVSKRQIVISLLLRTMLFFVFGGLFVGLFAIAGNETPLQAAEKWWPFQAILANIVTFFVVRGWMRREGLSFWSLFGWQKGRMGKDMLQLLWLLPVGFLVGGVPLYAFSYLLLGSAVPPELMFQPLPMWAAVIALLLFPLSNGLVETPTYIGYAMPRINKMTGTLWLAILLAGLALALQHIALPLVFDIPYMTWRFVSFIPLALAVGFIFSRTQRLFPIVLVHYIMDLQMAATLFVYSVNH